MSGFCINCGTELPEGAGFCPKCGTKVEVPHCPACGKEVDYGMDFCIHCGHRITEEKEEPAPTEPPELSARPEEVLSQAPLAIEQAGEEAPSRNDIQQFTWSYVKMGIWGVQRYDMAAALTDKTLHTVEQRRWGWKREPKETEIVLTDIQELCRKPKASILYWVLFSALAAVIIIAAVLAVFEPVTYVIFALFVGVYAWLGAFQLFHQELVILDRNGGKTVLKGAKKELFQQLAGAIFGKANVPVSVSKSVVSIIVASVAIGVVGTCVFFWAGPSESLELNYSQPSISELPAISQDIGHSTYDVIEPEDLIGYWTLKHTDTGEANSSSDAETEFLRIYADGSYDYAGRLKGNWSIDDDIAYLRNTTGTYFENGDLRIAHLKSGVLYLGASATGGASQFEKLSNSPDYEPPELSAESQTSNDISDTLFSQMPDVFYFSSGVGAWQTTLWLNDDGTFVGSYADSDMGDVDPMQYPNGTIYICDFNGSFSKPKKIDDYTYSTWISSMDYADPGIETFGSGVRNVTTTPYGLEAAYEIRIYLPGCPVAHLNSEIVSWLKMTEFYNGVPEELPFYLLINENEQFPFVP